jgi:hypothetical protein
MASKHTGGCKRIDAELASGKSPSAVAKQLKVSQKAVSHCQQNMNSASNSAPKAH